MYKLLNDLSGKTRLNNSVPHLSNCKQTNPSQKDIANCFNSYFANIGNTISESIPHTDPINVEKTESSMVFFPTNETEVLEIISKLDRKSSSGIDEISNTIVKTAAKSIVPYLTTIINQSLSSGLFPKELSKAKVLPLHKKGSKIDVNNYRPISLLNVLSKLFERVIYDRLYSFFDKNNLFTCRQYGFRKKHSTIDALIDFIEKIRLNNEKTVTSFFSLI